MKAHYRTAWLDALRSGKYKQGYERLRSANDEYCCLGVLGGMLLGAQWQDPTFGHRYRYVLVYKGACDAEYLTELAMDEAGLSEKQCDALIDLNDVQCKTFQEIADYIEQEIPAE